MMPPPLRAVLFDPGHTLGTEVGRVCKNIALGVSAAEQLALRIERVQVYVTNVIKKA